MKSVSLSGALLADDIQRSAVSRTGWTTDCSVSYALPMRTLPDIKKLDDCFGMFLVRVTCKCGASRDIPPDALARMTSWQTTLEALAPRMRCSVCGTKGAQVVAVPQPRPRGNPKNPH